MQKTASIVLLAASVAALVNPARRFPTIHRNSAPTAAAVSDLYSAPPYEPSWEELTQVPVTLNANDWTALGKAKRLAVLCRLSVVHLTVISCVSGGLLAAAAGKGNALRSTLWTATLCLWHLSHNVINDLQDLDVGRDEAKGAFRRSYGCHPVAQGFVSKGNAMKVVFALTAAAAAGSAASVALAPACAWAIPAGLAATLLYTPLAKPCALGELLVYLVWGPAMVGGGYAATAGVHSPSVTWLASLPLGLGAFAMIFGKHIDKIAEPVRTLPKLLGRKLAKATAATALIGQHVASLLLVRAGILPAACLLSLASLPFETRAAVRILLTEEPPAEKPSSDVSYRGSMLPFVPAKAWPLWYVAVAGWQAVVYGYWFTLGLGAAAIRA